MHRKLFYAFNFLLLATFVAGYAIDYNKEWRKYQQEYFRRTAAGLEEKAAAAKDPARAEDLRDQARAARRQPIMIRQIIAKDLGRIDRCVTCHTGMDEFVNPSMTTEFKDHPFTGHPDVPGMVRSHPFQKYGCTTCHGGQGLSTDLEPAHGKVKFWEKPLLSGALLQSSCAKCHGNFETLKGAEKVAMGRKLVDKHGCLGCHSIRGSGGVVAGVDFSNTADKPLERIAPYNFSLIKDKDGKPYDELEWKLPLWIEAHLTNDPPSFVPNDPLGHYNPEPIAPSGMQDFTRELPAGGAQAVAAYVLSLTEENLPHRYTVPAPARREPAFASAAEHGRFVFQKYGCAGCHGMDAKKGRRNFNAMASGLKAPEGLEGEALVEEMGKGLIPTLPDSVGNFTRDELKAKIQNGVPAMDIAKYNPGGPTPPLYMPAWKDKIKGGELEDLITFLHGVAKKGEEW